MSNKLKIKYNDEEFFVDYGTTALEISKKYETHYKFPIVLASVNGFLVELSTQIINDCEINFYDLTEKTGNRVYLSGLLFVVILAVRNLYQDRLKVEVHHSMNKGLLIETNEAVNPDDVDKILKEMQRIVNEDLVINKTNSNRLEVIKYYESLKEYSKAEALKYNSSTTVTMYEVEELFNYFYSLMPAKTGVLKHFDLSYLDENSFLLIMPTVFDHNHTENFRPFHKIHKVFKDYRKWEQAIGIKTASDLNKIISSGKIGDIIKIDEMRQNTLIMEVAQQIKEIGKTKIILIAGPSSSGKTTTSKKLELYLSGFGLKPFAISMDDYFVDRTNTPRLPNGNYDYENIKAVDLQLFDQQISDLIAGKEVVMPTYDFISGEKKFKNKVKLGTDDIIIIEGIHALNPQLLKNIDNEMIFKIYLSALTEINIDNHNRIPTTDNRLLRRIIRDNTTRGHDVDKTLSTWDEVRAGEEKYIFPYQEEADVILNTALIYELGVLKTYVEPLLYSVEPSSKNYPEAIRLINYLRVFLPVPSDDIPDDSIIKEFIGKSYFKGG